MKHSRAARSQPQQRKPTIDELVAALQPELTAGDRGDRCMSWLSIALGIVVVAVAFALQLVDGKYHRLGVGEFISMISAGILIMVAGVLLRAYRLKRIHQTLRFMVQAAGADDAKSRKI